MAHASSPASSTMSSATSISNGQLTPITWELMSPGLCEDELWPTDQDVAEMSLMLYNPPAPLSWDRRSLKRLPPGAMPIKLIGEGAANVVFELGFPPDYQSAPTFQGWLLRMSKAPINGDTPRFNYIKQQEFYANRVRYLLRDHVVQQELVVVRGSNIVRKLNNFLTSIDHERKEKFRGSYIADTNWGFLVEDMRLKESTDVVLIEFKPKWLLQSPSAPADAIRCRQCALELFNFMKDPSSKKELPMTKPCPLLLGNKNAPAEIDDPFRIAPKLKRHVQASNRKDLLNVLGDITNHRVIHDLRAAQKLSDPDGPLFASRNDETFNFAMTIRDCTCFVQILIQPDSAQLLKLRLGDFDFKDSLVKFDRWQAQERDLITSGCYTADWITCDESYYHPPTACLLEWSPRSAKKAHAIQLQGKDKTSNRATASKPRPNTSKDYFSKIDVAALKTRLEPGHINPSTQGVCPFRPRPASTRI